MSTEDDARRLFKSFHGREARGTEIAQIGQSRPDFSLYVGPLYGISYTLNSERLPLFHNFSKSRRPLLYVSSDGRQIYILKGGYGFNEKGFFR